MAFSSQDHEIGGFFQQNRNVPDVTISLVTMATVSMVNDRYSVE